MQTILVVAAFVLFVLAGIGVKPGRYNLGWLGLACWVFSLFVDRL